MTKIIAIAFLLTAASAQAEWKFDSEVGFVSQSGNTEQENSFIKAKISTTVLKKYELSLDSAYINSTGEVDNVTTRLAESTYLGGRLGRTFNERFSVFSGIVYEKNRFAGFEDRLSGDNSIRYFFIKKEHMYLVNETGHRLRNQYAFDAAPAPGQSARGESTESQFARIYFEYGRNLSKTSKFKLWTETLYDFEESENVEVNFEPSIDVAIGELFSTEERPAQISLKVAYKGMFDNVPAAPGLERFDSIISTTLKVVY